ncbi:MAG TPA: hypothetical protein VFW69_09305 [Mycobacterium sp.]|nr:hypothetical protein [Mycobacterium sp.]
MAPLAVDPEALYAAGSAVAAAGGGLAANLTVLAAGFSAHTGVDRAGEVFGLAYQDAAKSLLKAAAAAVNACQKCGALIQQGASNYSKAEAASTLGGGGGVLAAPPPPAELAAPKAPGTMGPGEPPPLLWAIVESLVLELWPDGDVPGLHAAASRWRDFAAAASGVQRTLNGSKTLLDTQHLPEGDKIDHALNEIGAAAATIGEQCGKLAATIDKFADKVGHAQHAIRDLLHRIGSLGDLGHDVMLIIDGDAWDEIKKIAKDINDLLQHLGQEARACEQGIRLLMQAADREIVTCEKYARRGLTQFLGDDVGNPVATAFDTWINAHEGALKGAVGMGLGLVDLSPHWIAVDPQGMGATWTGLGKSAWKGSLFNAPLHPREFADARLQELKGLVHAEDWSGDRPGLGAGEVAFDVGTLFAPGLGEGGAAADGAGAAARGAEGEAEAAGAGGRAGGIAGARDALTGITRGSADLPKNLEAVTKDLPEIKPPTSGSPVALTPGKPIEAPVESAPRPADGAPGAPQPPTTAPVPEAPRPVGAGSPSDPATAPPSTPAVHGGPHDPVPPPAEAPPAPAGTPAGGAHEPASVPAERPHEPAGGPDEPAWAPATGSPAEAVPTAEGERLLSAVPQTFDHSPPLPPWGPPGEAAPFAGHSPAPAAPASPHFAAPNGHPAEVPMPGGGWHGPGEGGPGGGHIPGELPQGTKPHGDGDGGPTGEDKHQPPGHDGPPHGPDDTNPGHGDDGPADGLTTEKRDEIIATPKGARPDPSDYLPSQYIESQLQKFNDGATRFMPESNLEKYGIAQWDGTSFVMPKHEADAMTAATGGDLRAMETELGLPQGLLDSNKIVRIDIADPKDFNLRIPSGNEAGANEQWIPGGVLPNGSSEAVVDAGSIPPEHYTVTHVFE